MTDEIKLFSESHERKYSKGQILLYQGEKTENVFRINSGHVKVYDVTADGDEKLMLILGPGDIFPLVWTFQKSDSLHYFYETVDDATLSVVNRTLLLNSLRTDHQLALHMLEYFVDRTNDLMLRIECIEATSAKHKVAQVLLYLANSHGDEITTCAYKVRIPTTHQMIANMSGLNRSTASIHMKELETAKMFKDTASKGLIIQTDRLQKLLNE